VAPRAYYGSSRHLVAGNEGSLPWFSMEVRTKQLLTDGQVERSSVAANCAMNRERRLRGTDGYDRALCFDPVTWLAERSNDRRRWLDLCCGTGRALTDAAAELSHRGLAEHVAIVGVDLVKPSWPQDPDGAVVVEFVEAPLSSWAPAERFDLVTCVHGLHYVGDKLGLALRVLSWLAPDGLFAASLDGDDLWLVTDDERRAVGRALHGLLKTTPLRYDRRHHLVTARNGGSFVLPLEFLGADDRCGANYTGQPSVRSYYRRI